VGFFNILFSLSGLLALLYLVKPAAGIGPAFILCGR
jgi:hypothetical protein